MTNPRLAVDFAGILTKRLTFKIDNSTITYDVTQPSGSAQVGLAVTLESDAEIGLADDGEAVVGLLETVYLDGAAVVAVVGAVLLPPEPETRSYLAVRSSGPRMPQANSATFKASIRPQRLNWLSPEAWLSRSPLMTSTSCCKQ